MTHGASGAHGPANRCRCEIPVAHNDDRHEEGRGRGELTKAGHQWRRMLALADVPPAAGRPRVRSPPARCAADCLCGQCLLCGKFVLLLNFVGRHMGTFASTRGRLLGTSEKARFAWKACRIFLRPSEFKIVFFCLFFASLIATGVYFQTCLDCLLDVDWRCGCNPLWGVMSWTIYFPLAGAVSYLGSAVLTFRVL